MKKVSAGIIVSLLSFVSCSDDSSMPTGPEVLGKVDQTFNYPDGFVLFSGPYHDGDKGIEAAIQADGRIIIVG